MHRFKSAILAIFQFFQNGTFEPAHEIWHFFGPKAFFWSSMKITIRKNIHNMYQIQHLYRKKKSTKKRFSKKALGRIDFCFVLGSYESLEGLES
jgi:hypothetical protein